MFPLVKLEISKILLLLSSSSKGYLSEMLEISAWCSHYSSFHKINAAR